MLCILKYFANFIGKHQLESLSNKVTDLRPVPLLKRASRCFPVKFAKLLHLPTSASEDFDKRVNIIKKNKNHSSIINIKNSMSRKSHLSSDNTSPIARQVTSNEVNLILKISQQRKAVCCG